MAKKVKSIFRSAGELVGTVAQEVVAGKDKLVNAVSTEVTAIKKAVKKKIAKKKFVKKKAAPKKKAARKKKAAGKAKKSARKTSKSKSKRTGKNAKALRPRR